MFIIFIRAAIVYAVVIFSVRVMGKRQVGDLQPGELVITILISEVAAISLEDANRPVLMGVVAVFALVVTEIAVSVLTMKLPLARRLINGRSALVIEDGRIDQSALRRLRLTVTDLLELLRGQGIFDLSEVAFAILETNGSLSVLQKPSSRPATAGMVSSPPQDDGMPVPVVSDGRFLAAGAQRLKITKKDVEKLLRSDGLTLADTFLMTLDSRGRRVTVKKEARR